MSRLSTIVKDSTLYKKLTLAFFKHDRTFALDKGTTRKDITDALGHNSVKEFNNFLSDAPSSTKYLRVEELFIILENLETSSQKIILDYINTKFGFVCSEAAKPIEDNSSLETLLLKITSTNGEFTKEFLKAVEDGEIDEYENKKLNDIAYVFRSLIRTFELKKKGSSND